MTAVGDDFNRANSSSLGAAWTEVVGDWEIVSNRVQCNDDDGGTGYYLRYETDVGSPDMFAEAVTTATQANSASSSGLAVRMRAGANTSYQMTTRHAGDTIGTWRIVGGSETQLNFQTGANNISTPIDSGDTIRLEVVGALLRSKVQGALVGLTVDTTTADGQRGGLNGYNNSGTDVVELDDFAAGALAADGGLVAPYIAGVSAQVTGVGTTLTPTVPPVVAAGDLVVAHCTSRDAAQTMTAPGSEGWAAGPAPSQTGLEDAVFHKVWGIDTDDTTPTFSIGSGAAGWGVTLVVIRNPAHATAPWTSTGDAVVATGSQSNAASATVTAPSVSHDGTNRTVVRLFSSADDNALGAPSAGALAYGAAAYDSTDGNDFAQAMSLREDITVTTATGTATVTETVNGNDVSNGITLVLAVPAGGTDGTATPAAITAAGALPAPGGSSTTTAPAIAATLTAPAAEPATATQPATIVAAVALPPAGLPGSTTPTTIALPAVIPAPGASTGATPGMVVAVATIPGPAASGGGSVNVTPETIDAVLSALVTAVTGSAGPAGISSTVQLPAPAPATGVGPSPLAALIALPAPATTDDATTSPATVGLVVLLPQPTISGAGLVGRVVLISRARPVVDQEVNATS